MKSSQMCWKSVKSAAYVGLVRPKPEYVYWDPH